MDRTVQYRLDHTAISPAVLKQLKRWIFLGLVAVLSGGAALVHPGPVLAQVAPAAGDREVVASIQELLNALGYDVGPADGIAGQRTQRAIRAFQQTHRLSVDGVPSELLKTALFDAVNTNARTGAPAPSSATRPPVVTQERGPPPVVLTIPPTTVAAAAPPPSATRGLAGSRWRITDDGHASFEMMLAEDGTVSGHASARFWRWEQTGSDIRFVYDNGWGGRVIRSGQMSGDRMTGTARDRTGTQWRWHAERLPPPRDLPGWPGKGS